MKTKRTLFLLTAALLLFGAACGTTEAPSSSSAKTSGVASFPLFSAPTTAETAPADYDPATTEAASTALPLGSQASSASEKKESTAKPTAHATSNYTYAYNYEGIHPVVAGYDPDQWSLLLVNRKYALPTGYAPETAVCLPGVYEENRALDARAAQQYRKMYYAALEDGAELIPYSGYRRTSTQKSNFERKIEEYRVKGYGSAEAVAAAAQSILPPGCSEHEAGLAMDIAAPGAWGTRVDFANTKEYRWLMAHGAEYGFILRYPKDKQEITEITYEPWHWRYVGKAAAQEIMAQGICLEEYLGAA
ncbi:MAG: M15 family metallopeptidase [Oscillospiraceae bacterium]|jgi:D-alanyl-D-alanine carboxypeptidase|nr:M15 family metallopeptidase [Oscillospiraceae bacterium]